ncbi:telethonin [Xyrichtys novacula]|uniref:Telethonin n=1 Tax=Xyrichtys novacula TaxID=13765 RepID=A0AAV1FM59_XYRNO|nr:telethonin [Xyrichtys novacula]
MNCVSRGGCYLVNSYCELQEDNQWKKESYEACWLSTVLETRPQYRLTLSETDNIRKESYKLQQVVHFMVQRYPSQTLKLGSDIRAMTEHRLPLRRSSRGSTEQQMVKLEQGDKQRVCAAAQDLRKPLRVNFRASSLMSSPRETSGRGQRRE